MSVDINKIATENFIAIAETVIAETENKILFGIKQEAKNKLVVTPFPTLKTEEWKYTNLKKLLGTEFKKASQKNIDTVERLKFNSFNSNVIVVVNGILNKTLSDIKGLNDIKISTISEAFASDDESAKKYFNKLALTSTAFDYVNLSNFTSGLFVQIPENSVPKKPLQILNITFDENENIFTAPRNLIIAGKNSQATIIQKYVSVTGNTTFNNTITEVVVEENASLNIYKVEDENKNTYHFEKVDVLQKQDSSFNHYNFSFDGKLIRNDVNVKLHGGNIDLLLNGLYIGRDSMHIDNNTYVEHAEPHSTSNQLYKGIMDGNSHGIFSGKILVDKDAQLTNAFQNNNSILLSDTAKADSKPQLEIYADDVKCTHGATVGHLDESAMFYILSRGIPREKAKQMLITAFAEDVVSGIKIPELKEEINKMIFERLK